jgi:hypothetical protein
LKDEIKMVETSRDWGDISEKENKKIRREKRAGVE